MLFTIVDPNFGNGIRSAQSRVISTSGIDTLNVLKICSLSPLPDRTVVVLQVAVNRAAYSTGAREVIRAPPPRTLRKIFEGL